MTIRSMFEMRIDQQEAADNNGDALAGRSLIFRNDYDEACHVAGWCSLDDDRKLVFGVDKEDAVDRVMRLPYKYRKAITRIHAAVMELTGIREAEDSEGKSKTPSEEQLIAEAKKN